MHYPVELTLGSFKLSLHLIFETAAFFIGFRYFLWLRKRSGDSINEHNRIWILVGACFGAFFFSRLVGALEDPVSFYNAKSHLLYFYANKTITGGLLGGLLMVEITKKLIGEKKSSGDLFTYPLILAMIIGRIGCFTSGVYEQTYGNVTTLPWGMNLGDGLKRHPVTLYEIAFLLLVWMILLKTEQKVKLLSGYRFQLFMIAYLTFRFSIQFIKPQYTFLPGIGTIQLVCLAGLVYYRRTIGKLIFNPVSITLHE